MDIGIIGLGKLGFPVALAIDSKGHNVIGYDIREDRQVHLKEKLSCDEILVNPRVSLLRLSKIITSWPFFWRKSALQTPWIPAPIIPILNLLMINNTSN